MTSAVKAVYEGGVLRPLEPMDLGEHEQVYLLLLPDEPAKVAAAQRAALEALVGCGERQERTRSAYQAPVSTKSIEGAMTARYRRG